MFWPPASTPPTAAKGEACSLIIAMRRDGRSALVFILDSMGFCDGSANAVPSLRNHAHPLRERDLARPRDTPSGTNAVQLVAASRARLMAARLAAKDAVCA